MGGHVLESWKEEMIRIGRAEGHAEGHAEGRLQMLCSLVQEGFLAPEIAAEKAASEVGVSVEEFKAMCQKLVKA